MIKPYICYKKNCWSTDFSVLTEAELKEEEHWNEDLAERATPHTHEGASKEKSFDEQDPSKAINETKRKNKSELMDEYHSLSFYSAENSNNNSNNKDSSYLSDKSFTSASMGHDHENLEVNEYLIQRGSSGIKQSKFYYTIPEQLKKRGILLDYVAS